MMAVNFVGFGEALNSGGCKGGSQQFNKANKKPSILDQFKLENLYKWVSSKPIVKFFNLFFHTFNQEAGGLDIT